MDICVSLYVSGCPSVCPRRTRPRVHGHTWGIVPYTIGPRDTADAARRPRARATSRRETSTRGMSGTSRARSTARERALGALWGRSRDGWIDVPGAGVGTIFLRPVDADASDDVERRDVPAVCASLAVFAITGHNPMGAAREGWMNVEANAALARALARSGAAATWKSFGFSMDWREDGFACGFEDRARGRATMVALGRAFEQGAIYEYAAAADGKRLIRTTVPCAMGETVREVTDVVVCDAPPGFIDVPWGSST